MPLIGTGIKNIPLNIGIAMMAFKELKETKRTRNDCSFQILLITNCKDDEIQDSMRQQILVNEVLKNLKSLRQPAKKLRLSGIC